MSTPERKPFGLEAGLPYGAWSGALFHFAFVGGVVLLKSASNALVVSRYEAGALPLLYVAAALATSLLAMLDGALRTRVTPPRLWLVACFGVLLCLFAALTRGVSLAVGGLYLFAEAYATLTSVRFWAAVGETFDPRVSRRIFAVFGGASMLGSIAGGLVARGLSSRLGAVGLLPAAGASMGLALVFAQGMRQALQRAVLERARPAERRRSGKSKAGGKRGSDPASTGNYLAKQWTATGLQRAAARKVSEPSTLTVTAVAASSPARPGQTLNQSRGAAFHYLLEQPYPRVMAILVALLSILSIAADYVFRLRAGESLNEDQMAAVFGEANLWMGLFAAAFHFGVSNRILGRFGIFRYLGLMPLATGALGGVCLLIPGLAPAFALKVVESAGSLSITPTGLQLLYAPMPDEARGSSRSLIDGFVKKGGVALGGLALFFFGSRASAGSVSAFIMALTVLVLVVISELKTLYVSTIDSRLSRAKWDHQIAIDADARSLLVQALSSPDAQKSLAATELLLGDNPASLEPHLEAMLRHPSERIREKAARLAAQLKVSHLIGILRQMVQTDVRRPRDEAVWSLAALDPDAPAYLQPLLQSPDPGLRAAATAGLLAAERVHGVIHGPAERALQDLLRLGRKATPAERRETARLLGRLGNTEFAAHLASYLEDEDPSVRRIAITSVAEANAVELAPMLLPMLASRGERRAARQALARFGEAMLPLLERELNDRAAPVAVRLEMPRILRYLGTSRAADVMLFSNIQDDAFLRYRIGLALSRMRQQNAELELNGPRVREAIARRVDAYVYYEKIFRDLALALPSGAILIRAIGDRLDQNLETVFRLLGLIFPHETMLNVYHRFIGREPRDRAYALDLFENVVDEEMRTRVWPVLECYHRLPTELGQVERAPARLLELIVSKDAVLRATAIYTARRVAPQVAPLSIPEEGALSENVVEKVFLLEGVDIFGRSDVDDLAALSAIAKERRCRAGETIYEENDPGDALYVIVAGEVDILKEGQVVLHLGAKESFGETSLLDAAPRPAAAIASTDVHLMGIDRQDFLDLVSDRPELLKGVFAAVTRHLRLVLEVVAAGRLSAPRPAEAGAPATDPELQPASAK